MKRVLILMALPLVLMSSGDCSKKEALSYRGRLEIKGICMNYTISILDNDADTSLVVSSWTDENTGKKYKNVFKLGSPCTFPNTINAGDVFTFELDPENRDRNCMVCMAYYPVPPKTLTIKVTSKD